MIAPFRHYHTLALLYSYEESSLPLDTVLRNYFYKHKQLGAKDRKEISTLTYGIVRNRSFLDHLSSPKHTWENRLAFFEKWTRGEISQHPQLPLHIQYSFPKEYIDLLTESFGNETAKICSTSNEEAPTTIRVNTLKITRDDLYTRWENLYPIQKCSKSPTGITFQKRLNFFSLPEFNEGFFEVQDEGSQLVSELVKAKPKDWFLDFCAGSGGKALAIAPSMKNTGQIFLHDIRPHKLQDAKKRLKRAGVFNSQLLPPPIPHLQRKMDWILADVPCSGSGTLRRNPDMKWRFSKDMLFKLVEDQRQIFRQALSYLKPQGHIVYATCSLFQQENERQVDFFLQHYPVKLARPILSLSPESNGHDGFFGAVFILEKDFELNKGS